MRLSNYISDLLYRYDCVTVPGFGGFVTNLKSAQLDSITNTFNPPFKQISFNIHLQNNDGLLVNYIAEVDKCSYDEALKNLNNVVLDWKNALDKNEILELNKIGYLSVNQEKKIIFEPSFIVNYLTSSFGLSKFVSPQIDRISTKEKIAVKDTDVVSISNKDSKSSNILKYAAIFVVGLSIVALGSQGYNTYQNKQQMLAVQKQQQHIEKKIQQATFEIMQPLPSITIHATKEIEKFNIVVGAFRNNLNAIKKVANLKSKGFDAHIIGKNKWNLTEVASGSFANRIEAIQHLHKIRKIINKEAWLLIIK